MTIIRKATAGLGAMLLMTAAGAQAPVWAAPEPSTESSAPTPTENPTEPATETPAETPAAADATEPTTEAPASETPASEAPKKTAAGGHEVTYTVTATSELNVDVQYIATDPPSKAAYNADADKYLVTQRRTPLSPGAPLVYTATLETPGQWALVTASGGLRINPELHCEIAVDGEVVVSQQGGSGVTCSTQPW
ncbi:hypothetical protein MU0083_002206 [[Mycobacterium] kokjensenii]|uniref:Peptidase n=1 Tax=[Mycobacterium] kokjensenii TaxID=3064287 RepID=A0ABM9LIF2_9MYCO|nr:hypothetical protein [Mycolicibacter sp. MU0083]CAJ1499552.1 hypothetical protein MU0083_002206 [Mycolicibacter sp. MU0083]